VAKLSTKGVQSGHAFPIAVWMFGVAVRADIQWRDAIEFGYSIEFIGSTFLDY